MINVTILGAGNVAQHLVRAIANSDTAQLRQVWARDKSRLGHLLPDSDVTDDLSELEFADLYIIAVSDDAIQKVAEALPFSGRLVAHTSGSAPISAIGQRNRPAVFYPLQTLSKNKAVNFREVPLCLEAANDADLALLKNVARNISDSLYIIDSGQRKALHVAAVFAGNFTNHMYALAKDICSEHGVSFDVLRPLIAETASKIRLLSPAEAQTGPAKRHDLETIDAHLDLLEGRKREIYRLLTQSIAEHE
jgi:predicted short-subunit dehydrogenase-like oxidoreductase (DUF2520 family)